jgi:hypothetical protein
MPPPETIAKLESELLAAHTAAEGFLFNLIPNEDDLPAWSVDRAKELSVLFHSPLVRLLPLVAQSPMLGDLDAKAIRRSLRTIEAALRLRGYDEWEPEVIHDEGRVLGLRPAGFSENRRLLPAAAREAVRDALTQISRRIAILRAQSEAEESGEAAPTQKAQSASSMSIQPGTASSSWRSIPTNPA